MRGLITASRLATLRRCPREHHYRYALGLQSEAGAAAARGTLLHAGLEHWWLNAKHGLPPLDGALYALRAACDVAAAKGQDVDPYDLARAEALMVGYDARWGGEAYEVLGVETEWRADLPQPGPMSQDAPWLWTPDGRDQYQPRQPLSLRIGGKVDVLVRDADRRTLVVEHKSTTQDASPGSPYWARLRLDGQVSLYHEGLRSLGYDVQAVLYDVIVVPRLKPEKATEQVKMTKGKSAACPACRGPLPGCPTCSGTGRIQTEPPRPYAGQRLTDETPDEFHDRIVKELAAAPDRYFIRQEVVRLEAESRQHLADVQALARRLGDTTQTPENCVRFGSVCSFFPLCTGEKRESDYARLDWPHPELTEGT